MEGRLSITIFIRDAVCQPSSPRSIDHHQNTTHQYRITSRLLPLEYIVINDNITPP